MAESSLISPFTIALFSTVMSVMMFFHLPFSSSSPLFDRMFWGSSADLPSLILSLHTDSLRLRVSRLSPAWLDQLVRAAELFWVVVAPPRVIPTVFRPRTAGGSQRSFREGLGALRSAFSSWFFWRICITAGWHPAVTTKMAVAPVLWRQRCQLEPRAGSCHFYFEWVSLLSRPWLFILYILWFTS